jgi:hypothetical protein
MEGNAFRYWKNRIAQAVGLLVASSLCGLTPRASGADPKLEFTEIKIADMQVAFMSDECDSLAEKPAGVDQLDRTQTKRFVVFLDPTRIKRPKYSGFFNYVLYLEEIVPHGTTRWSECHIKVTPTGAFIDRTERAHFSVTLDSFVDSGEFKDFPIPSIADVNLIKVETNPTNPQQIPTLDLSEPGTIPISIENLSKMGVTVTGRIETTFTHPEYWENPDSATIQDGNDLHLAPGEKRTVYLHTQPKRFRALIATLKTFKPTEPHADLTSKFSYSSDVGGSIRSLSATHKVRFEPSIQSLALALLCGSLLGTLAGQFLPKMWKGWRMALNRTLRGLVFSTVAEVLALLLVGLGSRFVIFTFDLDPWQVLPVTVIGLLTSGGKELLSATGLKVKLEP